jgi:DNA gyrase/topoisomerase IV subunit A
VISTEKVDEWIKEVQERPESAPLIIQFLANRLRDLTTRNESLVEENIALMTGKRVEEYEGRIEHLEYQLELLKRQASEGGPARNLSPGSAAPRRAASEMLNLLIYHSSGRVLRIESDPDHRPQGGLLGRVDGLQAVGAEPPRLLAAVASDELMFAFSSGRVAVQPVNAISHARPSGKDPASGAWDWTQAPQPEAPRAGETLTLMAVISRIALAENLIQVSRRGYVKKIRAGMTQSILANHYIGAGIKLAADRAFELCLSAREERLILVSWEGYLLSLDLRSVAHSIEEGMRLNTTDHLSAAFVCSPDTPVLVMTQIGKAVIVSDDSLKQAGALRTRGQPVFSQQRRAKGVRVVAAGPLQGGDLAAGLHQDGSLALYAASDLMNTGSIEVQGELLAFCLVPGPGGQA